MTRAPIAAEPFRYGRPDSRAKRRSPMQSPVQHSHGHRSQRIIQILRIFHAPAFQNPDSCHAPDSSPSNTFRTALDDLRRARGNQVRTVAAQYTRLIMLDQAAPYITPGGVYPAIDAVHFNRGALRQRRPASRIRIFFGAGCIRELCAGTLMGSVIARRAPFAVAISMARPTAGQAPQ